jgi:hypothetical protein
MELPDTRSADYRIAAGDSVAFRRASNILDMAIAAVESAAALESETEDTLAGVVAANEFFRQVRYNIVFNDTGGPVDHVVMGNHGGGWDVVHAKYLRQAEESYRMLEAHGRSLRSERFKECIGRLMQKISDGQKLEMLPSR